MNQESSSEIQEQKGSAQSINAFCQFAIEKRRTFVIIVVIAVLTAVFFAVCYSDQQYASGWDMCTRIIALATLAVAVVVWFGEIKEDLERQMQRRINVYFMDGEKPLLVCLGALLPGEHDARNLAQQIGKQMVGNQNLAFDATEIELRQLRNVYGNHWSESYKLFQIKITLSTSNTGGIGATKIKAEFEDMEEGQCYVQEVKPGYPRSEGRIRGNSELALQPE